MLSSVLSPEGKENADRKVTAVPKAYYRGEVGLRNIRKRSEIPYTRTPNEHTLYPYTVPEVDTPPF